MTNTTADYLPNEALTAAMTAREWSERFAPATLELAMDIDRACAERTAWAHTEAARIGLPHSEAGAYPPVVWELEYAKNC